MSEPREFDVVLLGATGFAGGHAAARLAEVAPAGLRWAVAGRRPEALAGLVELHGCGSLPADVTDPGSLTALARSTRVLLSTAGPFSELGDAVVDACVSERTHYADLTGEVPFMRGLIDRYHRRAEREGVTILPASGFDSVPAEIATLTAMQEAERRSVCLESLRAVYRLRGGLNGGTLASAIGIFRDGAPRLLADPYSLVPDATATSAERRALGDPMRPTLDATGGRYVAPFFMGAVNRRVVRRMIELARAGQSPAVPATLCVGLSDAFRYDEYQTVSKGRGWFAAWMATGALGATATVLSTGIGRRMATRFGPAPGEGPSEEALRLGFTKMTTTAFVRGGESFVVQQDMQGDPGNAVTVRILVEVGLALAAGEARAGGVLTPMSALGGRLVERLLATGEHSVAVSG